MLISKNTLETENIAKNILKKETGIKVFYLYGDLGSGKTTFTKSFVEAMGVKKFNIKSPTYTYIRKYELEDKNIYHIDLYRIEDVDELLFQEIEELVLEPKSILIIEWADKLRDKLDATSLDIRFKYLSENEREIVINN